VPGLGAIVAQAALQRQDGIGFDLQGLARQRRAARRAASTRKKDADVVLSSVTLIAEV
jgi:hypothetical protein